MTDSYLSLIFFFYGLAFFSMGLAIVIEIGRSADIRLRRALIPLALFGFIHGAHEWVEMLELMGILPGQVEYALTWYRIRLVLLAISFIALATFGAFLLMSDPKKQRYTALIPLGLAALWGVGIYVLPNYYSPQEMWNIADVWTRYVIAIPAALIASAGLIAQQREFRKAGMERFGRDALWAAVAFFWYGAIGQIFTRASALPPSTIINQALFIDLFGFPVQLLRATTAIVAAIFVMRFLRSFEVEIQHKIAELRDAQLKEAQRREALRGEMLRQIVSAQEAERQRVARELHDETGQALTAIGLGLRGAGSTLGQDINKAAHNLRQLEGMVTKSLDELRRLISDLRPSHLDDLGLAATLRWYAKELEARAPIMIEVDIQGEVRELSSETKTALFRIAQEALTNTVKHADAKIAQVQLIYNPSNVRVIVSDNGIGFDIKKLGATEGAFGLIGMEERASLLDGEFEISSTPGHGTLIDVTIPYRYTNGE